MSNEFEYASKECAAKRESLVKRLNACLANIEAAEARKRDAFGAIDQAEHMLERHRSEYTTAYNAIFDARLKPSERMQAYEAVEEALRQIASYTREVQRTKSEEGTARSLVQHHYEERAVLETALKKLLPENLLVVYDPADNDE